MPTRDEVNHVGRPFQAVCPDGPEGPSYCAEAILPQEEPGCLERGDVIASNAGNDGGWKPVFPVAAIPGSMLCRHGLRQDAA
jgi:hypothetical protein